MENSKISFIRGESFRLNSITRRHSIMNSNAPFTSYTQMRRFCRLIFAVILWRNAIVAWRVWDLFIRRRLRTTLETARNYPRAAQSLSTASTVTMSSGKPPALRQWSQSLHEDIFKGLEFAEQSLLARIRSLLSHFDRSEPFDRRVHTRIQHLVKEETGFDTLHASENMSDGSRILLDNLWSKVDECLEEMTFWWTTTKLS